MTLSKTHFSPGGRSGQWLRCSTNTNTDGSSTSIQCPRPNNKRVVMTSNNDSTGTTTLDRQVNTILYSSGGRTVFGNTSTTNLVTFLGKREGQPGGIIGPLRNRF
jgi:hypothetical protein